jgi:hypothetical protein
MTAVVVTSMLAPAGVGPVAASSAGPGQAGPTNGSGQPTTTASSFNQSTVVDGGDVQDLPIGLPNATQQINDTRIEGVTDSTIKVYYNVTTLETHNVGLGSLGVKNFTVTNGSAGSVSVNQGTFEVVELTIKNLGGFNATNVSFELKGLDTTNATNDTSVTYDVNVTEGTSSDSRFDGSTGAPGVDDVQTDTFAIGSGSGSGPGPSEPGFQVEIDGTNSPVVEGETLDVIVTVNNTGGTQDTQTVTLDVGASQRDSTTLTLNSGENRTITLSWATAAGDAGNYIGTVASENDSASTGVVVEEKTIPPCHNWQPPTDPDGDGDYEDVTGDGEVTRQDRGALTRCRWSPAVRNNPLAFDFDDDGDFDNDDIRALAEEINSGGSGGSTGVSSGRSGDSVDSDDRDRDDRRRGGR